MGQRKSNIRKRRFFDGLHRDDEEWDLPGYLVGIKKAREENRFYYTKEIYIESLENAERAPPCSGEWRHSPELPSC
jgi:hypothetical protein